MAGHEIYGQDKKYLTLPAAARLLGLSVKTLRREARAGSFPTYVAGGARRRVLLTEVRVWIDSGRSVPSTTNASAHASAVVDSVLAREKDSEAPRDRRSRAIAHDQEPPK